MTLFNSIISAEIPTISVIIPSRKRLIKLNNFLNSLKINCEYPEAVEIVLCIDEDDNDYEFIEHVFDHLIVLRKKRSGLGKITFDGIAESSGEIIFLCNDDVEVKTKNWDSLIRECHNKFPDKMYLLAPNDKHKKQSKFVFPIFSRNLSLLLGDFPSSYKGAFIDTYLHEIFIILKKNGYNRLIFLDDIIFEHNHYRYTGEIPDQTYKDRDRFGDDLIFLSAVKQRIATAQLIQELIEQTTPRKNNTTTSISLSKSIASYLFSKSFPRFYGFKICVYFLMRFVFKTYVETIKKYFFRA